MFKSLRPKHALQGSSGDESMIAPSSVASASSSTSSSPALFSKLSANQDLAGTPSSFLTDSGGSTRVPSSDGGDRDPPSHVKAPKVPVLSANGKKLVEKLGHHCKVTSEFPLIELLKNTRAVAHGQGHLDLLSADNEMNAADKLQLAVDATAFARDDDCCDVPEERSVSLNSHRLRSCMKKCGTTQQQGSVHHPHHPHPRPVQLRKRVCFRSGLADEGEKISTAAHLGADVTELHLYELVRLKHRFIPGDNKEVSGAVIDKLPLPRNQQPYVRGMLAM